MQWKEINAILKKNQKYFNMLEEYDRTGHLPIEKIRRSFTIKRASYKKLKELSAKEKKPMSRILDEMIEKS